MSDPGGDVRVEQVIDEVLGAELEAESTMGEELTEVDDRPDEIDEQEACGSLDNLPSEAVVAGGDAEAARVGGVAAKATATFVATPDLDSVPLFFARGVPPRPQTFSIERQFRDVLIRTVRTVRSRAPRAFGELVRITSAGALVNKPGMHGLGRAFDHDAWTFSNVDIRPIEQDHAGSLNKSRRYWALAALMRSHSAFILHAEFDDPHKDHLHQDNGGSFGFTTSSQATVKLAQAICNVIFDESPRLVVDGDLGPLSREAIAKAMKTVDLSGDVFDTPEWIRFLRRSGRLGFRLSLQS